MGTFIGMGVFIANTLVIIEKFPKYGGRAKYGINIWFNMFIIVIFPKIWG